MAYRRRGRKISEAKRLKVQARERRQVQTALDDLEFAKQVEARKRSEYGMKGLSLGGLIAMLTPAISGPAAIAAMLTGGKALGDVAYHKLSRKKPGEGIQDQIDALIALQDDMVFKETEEAARRGVLMGEMSKEEISGGDLETGLIEGAGDFLKYYTTLAAIGKIKGKGGLNLFESWEKGLVDMYKNIDPDWTGFGRYAIEDTATTSGWGPTK